MKARDYCCCAIPLVNAGIYTTLIEQFSLGIIIGSLAVATPSIVGAATPSFAPWLLAIVCYVGAAIQIFGFIGVAQDKPILFRRYVTLHLGITTAAFAIAAAWVIISASRHSTALSNCQTNFYPAAPNGSNTSEGQTVCGIITWVDVGLMAGAWVFFAIVQTYLLTVVSSYGSTQRHDHEKYDALNDTTKPLTDNIPMAAYGDHWDYRASAEDNHTHQPGHMRNESTTSTAMNVKENYVDGSSYLPPTYPPQHQPQFELEQSPRSAVLQPSNAYTQSPQPTPYYGTAGPTPTEGHATGY